MPQLLRNIRIGIGTSFQAAAAAAAAAFVPFSRSLLVQFRTISKIILISKRKKKKEIICRRVGVFPRIV